MKRISILLLLVATLLCSVPAIAQDKVIQKPTRRTQTTPAPKSSSSTTSDNSSNKSSTTESSMQSSTSNRSESQTTKQPSYIYPVEPEKAKPTTGYINGHEWVDLGLSVKWATCNVGASSPSDYGNYYAWGETRTKSSYTIDNSVMYGKNMGSIAGNSTYDAARANWGGTWRLPTASEIDELINKCKWEWTTQGGHNGYKVKGYNGNSIFLPATGWRYETSLNIAGEVGYYWSATPENYTGRAYVLHFGYGDFSRKDNYYVHGQSVRPVSE